MPLAIDDEVVDGCVALFQRLDHAIRLVLLHPRVVGALDHDQRADDLIDVVNRAAIVLVLGVNVAPLLIVKGTLVLFPICFDAPIVMAPVPPIMTPPVATNVAGHSAMPVTERADEPALYRKVADAP